MCGYHSARAEGCIRRTSPVGRLLLSDVVLDAAGAPLIQVLAVDAMAEDYVPTPDDERERISLQVRARRGQSAFREGLRAQFKDACVVTGCRLPDILEAAHILPYRGRKDHHVENGLLLRADIHTLFDLDLMGIDPATLKVHFHPKVKGMGYEAWEGVSLACEAKLLSRVALHARWRKFQARE